MIEIITPKQFKQTPWKNGQGFTTELAINQGGSLANFDWRLSIASVVENGFFSDFSGYKRDLVLIDGNGISLAHDKKHIDNLFKALTFATFNGSSKTYGTLIEGPINDFNLMVKIDKFQSQLKTYAELQSFVLKPNDLTFIYSLDTDMQVGRSNDSNPQTIPAGCLIKITQHDCDLTISGSNLIISSITPK